MRFRGMHLDAPELLPTLKREKVPASATRKETRSLEHRFLSPVSCSYLVLSCRHAGLPRWSSFHLFLSLFFAFCASVFAVLLLSSRDWNKTQQFELGLLLGRRNIRVAGLSGLIRIVAEILGRQFAVHIDLVGSWQGWFGVTRFLHLKQLSSIKWIGIVGWETWSCVLMAKKRKSVSQQISQKRD